MFYFKLEVANKSPEFDVFVPSLSNRLLLYYGLTEIVGMQSVAQKLHTY